MEMEDIVLLMLSSGLFTLSSVLLCYLNEKECDFIPLPLLICLQFLMVITLVNSGVVIGKVI